MHQKIKMYLTVILTTAFTVVVFQSNGFAEDIKKNDSSVPEKIKEEKLEKKINADDKKIMEEKMDMKPESKKNEKKEPITEKTDAKKIKEKVMEKSSMKWYRAIPVS